MPPAGAALPLPLKVELHAVLDPGGDFNVDDRLLSAQAVFICILGLGLDALSQTSARRAGRGRLHLAQNGVGHPANLSRTTAGLAGVVFDAFSLNQSEHLDLFGHAFRNFFQGQLHFDAQVGPLGAAWPTASAAAKSISKTTAKNVSELAEDVIHVHATTSAGCTSNARMSKAVILGPLVLIAQHLVGFCSLLEPRLQPNCHPDSYRGGT